MWDDSYGISIKGQPHKGHPIPIYNRRESIGTHRTLLVGDAAGLVYQQIGRNHQLGMILTRIFHLCFELIVRNPIVTRAVVEMVANRIGYDRVILYLFASFPLFLFSEIVAGLARLVGAEKAASRIRKFVYSI